MATAEQLVDHYILQADERHMLGAVQLAKLALWQGQAGYGCVIIDSEGKFLGSGKGSETLTDCTCHSEVVAIREAMLKRGGLLLGATLYSTFEPCLYCIGAILHSKVSRVVWGCERKDLPALYRQRRFTATQLLEDTTYPPTTQAGVLRQECLEVTVAGPRRCHEKVSVEQTALFPF